MRLCHRNKQETIAELLQKQLQNYSVALQVCIGVRWRSMQEVSFHPRSSLPRLKLTHIGCTVWGRGSRATSTHPLMNLSSAVSSRCLGHTELEFGLRQSLKWEVGCEPHHPKKIPGRLDTSLSHSSLLSSCLLTFTSCKLWTTDIMPSWLDELASGGCMKALPSPTPSWGTCLGWGRDTRERRATTPLLLSPLCVDSLFCQPRKECSSFPFLLYGCGWSQSQISLQFLALLACLRFKIHMLCGSMSTGWHLSLSWHHQSGTVRGST